MKDITYFSETFSKINLDFFIFLAAEPHIGKGFLIHAETMKKVYTEYCINHDKAEQLLEKYEQIPEVTFYYYFYS